MGNCCTGSEADKSATPADAAHGSHWSRASWAAATAGGGPGAASGAGAPAGGGAVRLGSSNTLESEAEYFDAQEELPVSDEDGGTARSSSSRGRRTPTPPKERAGERAGGGASGRGRTERSESLGKRPSQKGVAEIAKALEEAKEKAQERWREIKSKLFDEGAEELLPACFGGRDKGSELDTADVAVDMPVDPSELVNCGETLPQLKDPDVEEKNSWARAAYANFKLRGPTYLKDKEKLPSAPPVYQAVTADMFASPGHKHDHVARYMKLPPQPKDMGDLQGRVPGLIVINVQVPTYSPTIFGPSDGEGFSFVLVFELADGGRHVNAATKRLLEQIWKNERDPKGEPYRDRLKLTPRIQNLDGLKRKGVIPDYQMSLIKKYNGKPVLLRPQFRVYHGEGYMEIDVDVHEWKYISRRVFFSLQSALKDTVVDLGWVIQGNTPDELPEQLLTSMRFSCLELHSKQPNVPGSSAAGRSRASSGRR